MTITQYKDTQLAKRFFKDLGDKEVSLDMNYGTIVDNTDNAIHVTLHRVNKQFGTGKMRSLLRSLDKYHDIDIDKMNDGDECSFTTDINNTVEIALILGAKRKKVVSEEQRLLMAERLKSIRQN